MWSQFILFLKIFQILFMPLLFKFIFLLLLFLIKFFESTFEILIVLGLDLWFLLFHFGKKRFNSFSFFRKFLIFPVFLFFEVLKNQKWTIWYFRFCDILAISFNLIWCEIAKLDFHGFNFLIKFVFNSFYFCVIILLIFNNNFISDNFTHNGVLSWCH